MLNTSLAQIFDELGVFTTCASLPQILNTARATGGYERKLARVPWLNIDDFGLEPLRAPVDEDLNDLIAERHEQAATIVTSKLDFTEWDQAFPASRLLASASLDRLRHNAYCLVLDRQSHRAETDRPGRKIGLAEALKIHPGVAPRDARFTNLFLAPTCRTSVAPLRRSVTPMTSMSSWPYDRSSFNCASNPWIRLIFAERGCCRAADPIAALYRRAASRRYRQVACA